jgi:hypothetical protein
MGLAERRLDTLGRLGAGEDETRGSSRLRVSARSTAASSVRRVRSRPSLTGCSGLAARDLA